MVISPHWSTISLRAPWFEVAILRDRSPPSPVLPGRSLKPRIVTNLFHSEYSIYKYLLSKTLSHAEVLPRKNAKLNSQGLKFIIIIMHTFPYLHLILASVFSIAKAEDSSSRTSARSSQMPTDWGLGLGLCTGSPLEKNDNHMTTKIKNQPTSYLLSWKIMKFEHTASQHCRKSFMQIHCLQNLTF